MLIIALIVVLLLTIAAFFSAAETALTTASKPLMHHLDFEGDKRAGTVTRLLDKRESMISTVLLGNNLVNILASALTTSLMIELFGNEGIAYATAIMTVLVVIYGEILPKTYALLHSTTVALRCAGIMAALVKLFGPFNTGVDFFVKGALRMFGVPAAQTRTSSQILAELRGAIEVQMADRHIKDEVKHERVMLRSVLDLADVTVGEVMIHRRKVVTLNADLPMADIIEQIAESPYSRVPLWRNRPDNIVGLIHAKAVLRALDSVSGNIEKLDVMQLATKPWFIPDATTLLDQLHAFRERREHFALVVDEYGTLLGAVTLEDILEEIVGDIRDEHDNPVAGVRPQTDGSYLIDGTVTLRDLNRELDWSLPDDKASTVAGFILHEARAIPDVGQNFLFHGFRFQVVRRTRNQLTLVRVTPPKSSRDPGPAAPNAA
jgi:Mg2+/Co2+ transporter CorB